MLRAARALVQPVAQGKELSAHNARPGFALNRQFGGATATHCKALSVGVAFL